MGNKQYVSQDLGRIKEGTVCLYGKGAAGAFLNVGTGEYCGNLTSRLALCDIYPQ